MNYHPTTILRMREYGESVLSNLASNDPRISGSVRISHPDGSSSVVAGAYPQSVGDWLFVFSLIDGFVLFGKDDVTSWRQDSNFVPTTLAREPVARTEPAERKYVGPQQLAA
jgi:hypothetical protein